MDYESLYKVLPKEPKKWQVQDVVVWLQFVGLSQLSDKFVSLSIDGSILEDITENEIEEELEISQKIVKKKIMNWLTVGLKEYSKFLASMKVSNFQVYDQEQAFTIQKLVTCNNNDQNDQLVSSIKSNSLNQSNTQQEEIQQKQQQSQKKLQQNDKVEHQLILQPLEGQQHNFYCIRESGAKIGRHSSNQILILEENISRYHAEVVFQDEVFGVKDIGSTTGTYIKILKSVALELGMLIELGSNLFQVQSLEQVKDGIQVTMTVIEGPNQDEVVQFVLSQEKQSVTLGRKATVDIPFSEDHHLSNQHAKFYLIDQKVTLEDHSSTNGTWLRLSPEGQGSPLYFLDPNEQIVIRIGTTNQYICTQNKQTFNEVQGDYTCIICCEKDRDALYLPCKHNATCLKCSKNLPNCPICRVKIQEQIRIYKN